ncbi:ornithine--oxo-acid transaminase [Aeromicrobium fastidiosum]|uniref:ornithine aminotransferase n=1 Tax=Aeromicrobium fastidiosum TaxID=52699 RepID=A0A641AK52_9ACTN|nr:ornithine--oxo-acid transaminase [Aeromicrobium fastidiosum]KAA1376221.1 ornithine--oxo-acid transaminase [Aeromicrobium fastidiosum]MBP2391890.1 ornithine--oxo-acid transaminase [Aeromicrobium fastidiosum]
MSLDTASYITLDEQFGAHNYHPLPVVIAEAEGAWVTDVEGKRYLDFLSGYSALNFGHRHPALVGAARDQLDRLTLTSRAFHNDQYGAFCRELAALTQTEMVLTMNTGAEAVESAIKVARKWAYEVKGVAFNGAEIIVASGNFHGRTTTIVSFSDDPAAHDNYGPFTPGFVTVPYGDLAAIEAAITPNTAAILLEPIQGEAGVVVPPSGYFPGIRRLCDENDVLMIADEIQSGLARTGRLFALDHDDVRADLYTLGKALGGGIIPVSAVVGRADVLGVLKPGQHGSTFGGYPVACAVGRAVVGLLETGEFQARSLELGRYLHGRLDELVGKGVATVRGRGLWAGVDIDPLAKTGREVSMALRDRGVLCKETHERTLRIAPPLVITKDEIDHAVGALAEALEA